MKHTWNVTIIILVFFFITQIIGLFIINGYIDHEQTISSGEITANPLPGGLERPEIEESTSYLPIFIAIIIGTGFVFLIMKLKLFFIWKFWFFLSVLFCLTVAFGAFVAPLVAFIIALILTSLKVFKSNIYIHNLSEIFIYGGLAAIFVFFINIWSAFILLLLISLYDMFSVWQSKHMVKLAEFQTEQKLFAGIFVPYCLPGKPKKKPKGKVVKKTVQVKSAILGGGDIGFPLIFSGVVFKGLIITTTLPLAFLKTFIITITTSIALLFLFIKAESDKYYPAMPFVTIGCLIGYGIVLLL